MTIKERIQRKAPTQLDEQRYAQLSRLDRRGGDVQRSVESNHTGTIQRASLDPSTLTPQDAQYLQRTIGNAQLTTLLQNHNGGDDGSSIQRTSAPTQINFERSIQRMTHYVDLLVSKGKQLTAQSPQHQTKNTEKNIDPALSQVQRTDTTQQARESGEMIQLARFTFKDHNNESFYAMLTTPDELIRDGGKMSKTGTTTYDTIVGKLSDFVSNASTYTPSQIVFKLIEIRILIRRWNLKHEIKSMFQTPRYRALNQLYKEAKQVMNMISQSRKRKKKRSIYDDEGVTPGQNNIEPLVGGPGKSGIGPINDDQDMVMTRGRSGFTPLSGGPGKSGVGQLDDLMDMDMVVTSGETDSGDDLREDEFEIVGEKDELDENGSTPMGISLKEFMDEHTSKTPGHDDIDVDLL
ncbi:MAG: hypothetical protein AAF639_42030 [Chloroflexota bacterium]